MPAVRKLLDQCRDDGSPDVRLAAEAALARLGERRALQFFRQSLVGESDTPVADAVRRVAAEGLTWLWPELDALADADDPEVAATAREGLEQMRENMTDGLLRR
jgi:HEAT repeat protein